MFNFDYLLRLLLIVLVTLCSTQSQANWYDNFDLKLTNSPPDGDCFYHSIVTGLNYIGVKDGSKNYDVKRLRGIAADGLQDIVDNKSTKKHLYEGLIGYVSTDKDILYDDVTDKDISKYIDGIRNSKTWGGNLELQQIVWYFKTQKSITLDYVYYSPMFNTRFQYTLHPGNTHVLFFKHIGNHWDALVPKTSTTETLNKMKASINISIDGNEYSAAIQNNSKPNITTPVVSEEDDKDKEITKPEVVGTTENASVKDAKTSLLNDMDTSITNSDKELHKPEVAENNPSLSASQNLDTTKELNITDEVASLFSNMNASMDKVNENFLHHLNFTTAQAAGDFLPEIAFWTKGNYSLGFSKKSLNHKDHVNNKYNYITQNFGTILGFDFGWRQNKGVGAAFSYTKGQINYAEGNNKFNLWSKNSHKDKIETYMLSLYGKVYLFEGLNINGVFSYGIIDIEKENFSNSASIKGKGNLMDAVATIAYDINILGFHIKPFIGVEYLNYQQDKLEDEKKITKLKEFNLDKTKFLGGISIERFLGLVGFGVKPEFHTLFYKSFNTKIDDLKVSFLMDEKNKTTVIKTIDPKALVDSTVNFGGSIDLVGAYIFSAGIGYDIYISDEFTSHSFFGRVKFEF